MKRPSLLQTDAIESLAQFWDRHDLTDFEDELEEVKDAVFARSSRTIGHHRFACPESQACEEDRAIKRARRKGDFETMDS